MASKKVIEDSCLTSIKLGNLLLPVTEYTIDINSPTMDISGFDGIIKNYAYCSSGVSVSLHAIISEKQFNEIRTDILVGKYLDLHADKLTIIVFIDSVTATRQSDGMFELNIAGTQAEPYSDIYDTADLSSQSKNNSIMDDINENNSPIKIITGKRMELVEEIQQENVRLVAYKSSCIRFCRIEKKE